MEDKRERLWGGGIENQIITTGNNEVAFRETVVKVFKYSTQRWS